MCDKRPAKTCLGAYATPKKCDQKYFPEKLVGPEVDWKWFRKCWLDRKYQPEVVSKNAHPGTNPIDYQ